MATEQIAVADGKYTLIYNDDTGVMQALRHGEPWGRDLVGDNLVYWMFVRIRGLEAEVAQKAALAATTTRQADAVSQEDVSPALAGIINAVNSRTKFQQHQVGYLRDLIAEASKVVQAHEAGPGKAAGTREAAASVRVSEQVERDDHAKDPFAVLSVLLRLHDEKVDDAGAWNTTMGEVRELLANTTPLPFKRAGTPDFDGVRNMPMSELTPGQRDDAMELWLREQLGWMPAYHRDHYEFLLSRLDAARGTSATPAPVQSAPAQAMGAKASESAPTQAPSIRRIQPRGFGPR